VLSYFSNECEIELPGVKLTGREGVRKLIGWMYRHLNAISIIPVTIVIHGNVFFEEFVVKATIQGDRNLEVKQVEVLVYDEDYQVKNLRLYFDWLQLTDAFTANPMQRFMTRAVTKASMKGLR
jgi:hypothetical protein